MTALQVEGHFVVGVMRKRVVPNRCRLFVAGGCWFLMRIPGWIWERGWVRRWTVAGALTGFLFVQTALANVMVGPMEDCTQRPRIVVMKDGRAVAGAVVELIREYRYPDKPHKPRRVGRLLRTNSRGEVRLPALAEGEYSVLATLPSQWPSEWRAFYFWESVSEPAACSRFASRRSCSRPAASLFRMRSSREMT